MCNDEKKCNVWFVMMHAGMPEVMMSDELLWYKIYKSGWWWMVSCDDKKRCSVRSTTMWWYTRVGDDGLWFLVMRIYVRFVMLRNGWWWWMLLRYDEWAVICDSYWCDEMWWDSVRWFMMLCGDVMTWVNKGNIRHCNDVHEWVYFAGFNLRLVFFNVNNNVNNVS